MFYFVRRLIYSLFVPKSKLGKFILLISLLLLMFSGTLKNVFAEENEETPQNEEIIEVNENDHTELEPIETQEPKPEPTPEQETEDIKETIIIENNQDVIDYLEQQRKEEEKKAAELQAQLEEKQREEEEQAEIQRLEEEQQIQLFSLTQSQNNIVYGYLNNYRYYITGAQNTDRYQSQYIYVFDEDTNFKKEGGYLKYDKGCNFITISYDGYVTKSVCNSIDYSRWVNVYSNIDILELPSVYQISKDSETAFERFKEYENNVISIIFAIIFVYSCTNIIINGKSRRGI